MTSTTPATATTVHDPSLPTNIDLQPIADRPWLVALTAHVVERWSPRTRRQLAHALAGLLLVALDRDRVRDLLVGIYLARGGRARAAAERHYDRVIEQVAIACDLGEQFVETDQGHVRCRPLSPYNALARLGIDARRIVAESQVAGWRAMTIAQLELVAAAVAGDRWVVDQLVPTAEVTVTAGAPKSGKSWLALYVAVCVAAGSPVFDRYAVRQGPVIVIAEDDGVPEIEFRLRAISRGLGVDRYTLPIRVVVRQRVRIDNDCGIAWVRDQGTSIGARLVLLDSLSRLHGVEESSRSEMAPILDDLLYLADRTRVAILLVHHARKSGADGGPASAALRGSSDLAAVARSVLLVDRAAPGQITIDVDANYAISSQLAICAEKPALDDSDPKATFCLDDAVAGDSPARSSQSKDLRSQILATIRKYGPKPRTYVCKALKGRDEAKYKAMDAMVADGTLIEIPTICPKKNGGSFTRRDLALPDGGTSATGTSATSTSAMGATGSTFEEGAAP